MLFNFQRLEGQALCSTIGTFTPTITIGTDENSVTTTSGLGISGWYSQKVLIKGTLRVNSDFVMSSCRMRCL